MFTRQETPRAWREAEAECRAGAGHLVSLAEPAVEQAVVASCGERQVWTGGNICPDRSL